MLLTTTLASAAPLETGPGLDFTEMKEFLEFEVDSGYVESNAKKSCSLSKLSASQKTDIYVKAQTRLMDVNNWADLIGISGQSFRLFNSKGQLAKRLVREGDLIEIKLPMDPTLRTYWVKVEYLKINRLGKDSDGLHLVVRPTRNPFLPYKKGITDHFFENAATNTFMIKRTTTTLTSEVNGVNEKANTTQARSRLDAAANLTISEMGWGIQEDGKAGLGFQKLVWNRLNSKLADCD